MDEKSSTRQIYCWLHGSCNVTTTNATSSNQCQMLQRGATGVTPNTRETSLMVLTASRRQLEPAKSSGLNSTETR